MKLRLVGKKRETKDVVTFYFKSPALRSWKAGQYLHYNLAHDNADDRGQERYFTIASAPFEGRVQLTTRFAPESSTFKKALKALKPGQGPVAGRPKGDFVVEDPAAEHLFIAGGIGVTPYRAILLDLDHRKLPLHVHLLYANRDRNIVFRRELDALAKRHPEFRISYVVAPKLDAATIRKALGGSKRAIVYVSGPEPMVEAMEKKLKRMGLPKRRIRTDFFPGYDWP